MQIEAVAFKQKGKAMVRVKDAATGAVRKILTPFPGFTGRLKLLLQVVNGDGSLDLIVQAKIKGKLKKKTYDAVTLADIRAVLDRYPFDRLTVFALGPLRQLEPAS